MQTLSSTAYSDFIMANDITSLLCSSVSKPKSSQSSSKSPSLNKNEFAAYWRVHGSHLVTNLPPPPVFKEFYEKELSDGTKKIKIAAFDMDSTLIKSRSGLKFGKGANDWQWWSDRVVPTLKAKAEEKYIIAIFTNQGSTVVLQKDPNASKSYLILRSKINQIFASLKSQVEIPLLVFAATQLPGKKLRPFASSEEKHQKTRKPETGMWDELILYLKSALGNDIEIDMDNSFFVGDAAGREGDFLDTDKKLAENIGIRFEVPEDFFV